MEYSVRIIGRGLTVFLTDFHVSKPNLMREKMREEDLFGALNTAGKNAYREIRDFQAKQN